MLVGIKKGDRIEARWFRSEGKGPLPGTLALTELTVRGRIRHLRGDHPTVPSVIRLYVDPEGPWEGTTTRPHGCTCPHEHVEVNPEHVIRTLGPSSES